MDRPSPSPADPPSNDVPDGFVPIDRSGSWFGRLGPIHLRREPSGAAQVGMRIAPQHIDANGHAAPGMLATLADSALGTNLSLARGQRGGQVTVSLKIEHLRPVRLGDWVVAESQIDHVAQHLAFVECRLRVGEAVVMRARGVFSLVRPPPGLNR